MLTVTFFFFFCHVVAFIFQPVYSETFNMLSFLIVCFYLFIWRCQVLAAVCGISFPSWGLNSGPLCWERES